MVEASGVNKSDKNDKITSAEPFKSKFGLSFRGLQATTMAKPMDTWVKFGQAYQDKYCSRTNPGGFFSMFVAENAFMKKEIHDKIQQINKECEWPAWIYNYGGSQGNLKAREAVAGYMQKYWI